jgi:hypothetical protein
MILNEQKYSSKTRLYYHGTDSGIVKRNNYSCLFLTTKIVYALHYTDTLQVFIGTIRAPLNIFNARSNIDLFKLKEYSFTNEEIRILQNEDWFDIKERFPREDLLKYIKQIGYDGIFNFEKGHETTGPSIGLFDDFNFIPKKLLQYGDLIKMSQVREYFGDKKREAYDLIKQQIIKESKSQSNKSNFWNRISQYFKYFDPDLKVSSQKIWDYYLHQKKHSAELIKDDEDLKNQQIEFQNLTGQEKLFETIYKQYKQPFRFRF